MICTFVRLLSPPKCDNVISDAKVSLAALSLAHLFQRGHSAVSHHRRNDNNLNVDSGRDHDLSKAKARRGGVVHRVGKASPDMAEGDHDTPASSPASHRDHDAANAPKAQKGKQWYGHRVPWERKDCEC